MIPGIVASRRVTTAPPTGAAPALRTGQVATRTGAGTLTLPAAPVAGNLLVVAAALNTTLGTTALGIPGFVSGPIVFGGGDGLQIRLFWRIAQTGDSASATIGGSNPMVAAMYEFTDAVGVALVRGHALASPGQYISSGNYDLPAPASPYGEADLLIGVAGHLTATALVNASQPNLTTDISGTSINVGAAIWRYGTPRPVSINGALGGGGTSFNAGAFGVFAVIGTGTPE